MAEVIFGKGTGEPLFSEAIKIENGSPINLSYHEARMKASGLAFFGPQWKIDLAGALRVPKSAMHGVFKCRITYGAAIESVEYAEYEKPLIRTIRLVPDDGIEYGYKLADRSRINALFSLRRDADEILIVKNGLVTDTSRANVALFDGERWLTPARPLLRGTKRQKLLDERIIEEADISVPDLKRFERLSCINAMLDLDEVSVPIQEISGLQRKKNHRCSERSRDTDLGERPPARIVPGDVTRIFR